MIPARPAPPGTAPFRPAVGGLRRPPVATGFRPVVAGQYLRADRQQESPPLTFLTPPAAGSGSVHLSVVVSPRVIWRAMNAAATGAPTTRLAPGAGGTTDGPPAEARPEAVDRFSLPREVRGNTAPPAVLGDDRLMVLRTHATPTSEFVPLGLGTDGGTASDTRRTAAPSEIRPASVDRLRWLRERAERETAVTNVSAAVNRDPAAYSPVALTLRNGPEGESETADGVSRRAAWESPFERRFGRSKTTWGATPPTTEDRRPGRGDELSLNVVVGRTLRRFARASAPGFREAVPTADAPRESATAGLTFGRAAEAGMSRPAALVPVVLRAAVPQVGSAVEPASALPGTGAAAFADSVAGRFVRRAEGAPATAAPPVSVVVRTRAESTAPAGGARPSPPDVTPFARDAAPPVPPPAGLPPDLVQRLTEQVVRSLDARATAARERRGGF